MMNRYGVKDQINCYRTINGERYIAWLSYPSEERIKAYRDIGLRVRRLGVELYIHEDDQNAATKFERTNAKESFP